MAGPGRPLDPGSPGLGGVMSIQAAVVFIPPDQQTFRTLFISSRFWDPEGLSPPPPGGGAREERSRAGAMVPRALAPRPRLRRRDGSTAGMAVGCVDRKETVDVHAQGFGPPEFHTAFGFIFRVAFLFKNIIKFPPPQNPFVKKNNSIWKHQEIENAMS